MQDKNKNIPYVVLAAASCVLIFFFIGLINNPNPHAQYTQIYANLAQNPQTTQTIQTSKPPSKIPSRVYITKTGKKYHYSSTCNSGKYYTSSLSQAHKKGLTPCSKCVE